MALDSLGTVHRFRRQAGSSQFSQGRLINASLMDDRAARLRNRVRLPLHSGSSHSRTRAVLADCAVGVPARLALL